MEVRPSRPEDRAAVAESLAARWSARVARRGVVVDPLAHPALHAGAIDDSRARLLELDL